MKLAQNFTNQYFQTRPSNENSRNCVSSCNFQTVSLFFRQDLIFQKYRYFEKIDIIISVIFYISTSTGFLILSPARAAAMSGRNPSAGSGADATGPLSAGQLVLAAATAWAGPPYASAPRNLVAQQVAARSALAQRPEPRRHGPFRPWTDSRPPSTSPGPRRAMARPVLEKAQ